MVDFPRIDAMRKRGMSKQEILDVLNGENNLRDLSREQLRYIGFGRSFIDSYMAKQRRLNVQTKPPVGTPRDPGLPPVEGDPLPDTPKGTSAYEVFKQTLNAMGLPFGADIEMIIRQAVVDGYGPDQITLILPEIQQTQTWLNRFPGWASRVSNGYNALRVDEYLGLENAYHRILQEAGLPKGFYDSPSDFGQWIANNVSPDEIRDRVGIAMDAVRQVDPTARDLLSKFYGVTSGDLASYFLDQKRALPVLDRQYKAANVASWAARNGLKVMGAKHYEGLIDAGLTPEMAAQGYSTVAAFNEAFGRIAGVYGESYSQSDAEQDVFFNKNDKRRRLLAQEAATFSGSSRGATGTAQRGTSY